MISRELVDKINSLWHKQQTVGLTEEEKEEQLLARRQYIDAIKSQVRDMLETIKNPECQTEDKTANQIDGDSCTCEHCKH